MKALALNVIRVGLVVTLLCAASVCAETTPAPEQAARQDWIPYVLRWQTADTKYQVHYLVSPALNDEIKARPGPSGSVMEMFTLDQKGGIRTNIIDGGKLVPGYLENTDRTVTSERKYYTEGKLNDPQPGIPAHIKISLGHVTEARGYTNGKLSKIYSAPELKELAKALKDFLREEFLRVGPRPRAELPPVQDWISSVLKYERDGTKYEIRYLLPPTLHKELASRPGLSPSQYAVLIENGGGFRNNYIDGDRIVPSTFYERADGSRECLYYTEGKLNDPRQGIPAHMSFDLDGKITKAMSFSNHEISKKYSAVDLDELAKALSGFRCESGQKQ